MIRNGFDQLYIPGSSIKGAIRTAIIYHLVQNAERDQLPERFHKQRIIELIKTEINDIRSNAKFADDKRLINPLLTDFKLEGVYRKVEDSNRDLMRLIHISDSAPLVEDQYLDPKTGQKRFENLAVIPEVLIISHYQDWNPKYKGSIYPEMVRNVKTEFTLSLDWRLLKKFKAQGIPIPFQNIADILQICREFAQAQWRHEENHWQNIRDKLNAQDLHGRPIRFDFGSVRKFYQSEANPFNLRLGWGCGFTGTSIGLALDDETRQLIRENCMPKKANGFEAPKTRRIAAITTKKLNREIRFVSGWIKLKVLSSSN
jgi:CRISPR-associated protein Csm5